MKRKRRRRRRKREGEGEGEGGARLLKSFEISKPSPAGEEKKTSEEKTVVKFQANTQVSRGQLLQVVAVFLSTPRENW